MPRPDLSRVPEFYHGYISNISNDDLKAAFKAYSISLIDFFQHIPVEKRDYRYADGKWSIKELLQHITDAERVFAYRSLCIARKDRNALPGFDEKEYAAKAKVQNRNWDDMLEEFKLLRRSTELMFSDFDQEQLEQDGIANGKSIYVLALGFILLGHAEHHIKVIRERYL